MTASLKIVDALGRASRVLVAGLLIAGALIAQTPKETQQPAQQAAPQEEKRPAPSVLVSSDTDYRIGPRDLLDIQVEYAAELSGSFNVGADGTFLMPYLGRMKAAGKTPEELSREITEGLRGKYLKEPRVTVAIKQYNSRSYIVQGSVRSPGVYQIEHGASLLKLIGLAGGLAENHGSTAFIIRELKPQPEKAPAEENPAGEGQRAIPQYEMIKANINGLYLGHFDQNIPIEPGDIINIPPTDVFFVAGEVVAPGSYPLKPGTTVRQAISLARGFTFSAAKGRGIIFREDLKTGRREDIKVDFGQVMNGKRDDIAIHPNDIVIVPNSSWKSFGGALLRGFGTSFVTRGIPY
jgi:polysaccharide export outer membrane protein